MHLVILALLALALAAYIICTGRRSAPPLPPAPVPITLPPEALEDLAEAAAALLALMDHPELGGPGFLSVQLPRTGEDCLTVTAQFPNIREALYRRAARGDVDPAELIRAGAPEALFRYAPSFAAESGGMVLLTAGVRPFPAGELDLHRRSEVLGLLTRTLQARFPDLAVRAVGSEVMLTRG